VVALRWPSWAPCRVLNWRVMTFLGELSYSLYLVHHVLLNALVDVSYSWLDPRLRRARR